MPVVVKGCHPYCWVCGALGHMSKVCTGKIAVSQPSQAAAETAEVSGKALDGDWREMTKKVRKSSSPTSSRRPHNNNNARRGQSLKSSAIGCLKRAATRKGTTVTQAEATKPPSTTRPTTKRKNEQKQQDYQQLQKQQQKLDNQQHKNNNYNVSRNTTAKGIRFRYGD